MHYEKLLLSWNVKINLTAITHHREIWIKHFLDSASLLFPQKKQQQDRMSQDLESVNHLSDNQWIPFGAQIADVGTGGGFPGIVLKILRPDIQLTLIDALQKRLHFLKHLSDELGMQNTFFHGRGEDAARKTDMRESFDVVTARAVANLSMLSEICIPLVKQNGVFVSMKGTKGLEELENAKRAISLCGGIVKEKIEILLPDDQKRWLFFIRKENITPSVYPRSTARIKKIPL